MPFAIPFPTSEANAIGAPAGDPIRLDGIRPGSRLLALVEYDVSGGHLRALNPHAFEVEDGAIVGDVATDGRLRVVWTTAPSP